jgi:hypothetical protein
LGATISSVGTTDDITLAVILTAGPLGSIGGSVSVDYSDAQPKLGVTTFQSMTTTVPSAWLPLFLGETTDLGGAIDGINAGAAPSVGAGIGLPPGQTAYLGTVSFHKDVLVNGTHDIILGAFGTKDGVADGVGNDITDTTTFNSAVLINVPEPGALSLLVMGVGGMLLAGRGRRS